MRRKNNWTLFSILATVLFNIAVITSAVAETPCIWAGWYAGGFAGGTTAARITSTEPLRLDNGDYWFRPFNNSFSYKTKPSFIGGITLGYNLQICNTPFLVGLEGEYGYLNLRGSSVDPNQFSYAALPNNNLQNASRNIITIGKSSGYGLIAGRALYTTDNDILFYIKSGVFFTGIKSKYNSVKTENLAPVYLNLSGTTNIVGYAIGGGIEYAIPFEGFLNMSAKLEYLCLGINQRKNVYGHCTCNFLWRMIEQIHSIHTIKIGINYNFE